MTAYTGTVTDVSGSYGLANENLLELIQTNMEANSWVTLRFDDGIDPKELIMQGEGLSGSEEIYVGFRSFQSVPGDYYNITLAAFDGYIPGNAFTAQPNYREVTLCAHNTSIGYWMVINEQRIALALKVGTPVYDSGYVGKFFPYFPPTVVPYPICLLGPLKGLSTRRFSDTDRFMPFMGHSVDSDNTMRSELRDLMGNWIETSNIPWYGTGQIAGSDNDTDDSVRDNDGYYGLLPIELVTTDNIWGRLDGIFHISGFNNAVENTLTINSIDYVVIQNIYRTGFRDFIAIRLD